MIKFFRNIRSQLLGKGKIGKYFKYAIGEVLLVMIGILLALQVNNWNERRKNTLVEKDLLFNIKHAFQSDLDNVIDQRMKQCQEILNVTNALINTSNNSNTFPDSLQTRFIWLGL